MRLRHRVFAYVAAAALASCLFSVVVAVVLVRNRISAQRSSQLSQEAGAIVASGEALHGQHVFLEVGGRIRVLPGPQGRTILRQVPDHGSTTGEVSLPKRRLLYATADTAGGRVVVVRAAQLAFADWRPFLGILLLAGAGGAVLAAFFSLLLARRLSAPIHDLAEATTRLAAGEGDVQVTSRGNDELAELADAFNRMSADLAAARAAQQTFLESVSHELKTPLASIRGYAEGIADSVIPVPDASKVIALESDRLERLVRDLLDLARIGRAEFKVEHLRCDLAEVASDVIARHQPRAAELGVELTREGQGDAMGDHSRLLQLVSNLVENALRMTPAGGAVTVTVAGASLSVTDTGPGISPEDLPHAFERFYLHERYRNEREVGSGLGLAIVETLARAMGGTVSVTNVEGAGARFTLQLEPA